MDPVGVGAGNARPTTVYRSRASQAPGDPAAGPRHPSGRIRDIRDRGVTMRPILRDNGACRRMLGIFLILLFLQSIAGWRVSNADDTEHRQPTRSYGRYLA